MQSAPQQVSGVGVACEESEGVFDGVDEMPVETEQLSASATGKDNPGHRSCRGSSVAELAA